MPRICQKPALVFALVCGLAHLFSGRPALAAGKEQLFDGRLDDYLAYAMENSPGLKAAFERWQASVHRIARARRLPDPKITYGFFLLSVETRLGPQRHRLGLSQTFPWPTVLTAGADAQAARARSAERTFDAEATRLKARVAGAYWELWLIRQTSLIRQELLGISRSSSDAVQARLVLGDATLADQQQIDLHIARLEDDIASLAQLEVAASARLVAAVGAPPGTGTPTIEALPAESLPRDSLDRLRQMSLEHPLLASYELRAQGSEAQARSERADRLPSFTLGVDWIEVGETSMPDVADSGRDALVVGLGISLPLWQRNYKEGVEASLADAAAHRFEGRAVSDQRLAALERELALIRDSHRRSLLHRNTLIPQATAALDSVLGAYATGRGTVASILIAERELLDLKESHARLLADHQAGWARLEENVGRSLETRTEHLEETE